MMQTIAAISILVSMMLAVLIILAAAGSIGRLLDSPLFSHLVYCHDPRRVAYHHWQRARAVASVARMARIPARQARALLDEIGHDYEFLGALLGRFWRLAGRVPGGWQLLYLGRRSGSPYYHGLVLYALVRACRPRCVVETGGTPGISSAFILRALQRNGQGGKLYTIDLPPSAPLQPRPDGAWLHDGMPAGQGTGWAVPDELRGGHVQIVGNARYQLPVVLRFLGSVDLFIHDSDHSADHMAWEYETAWPFIQYGGLLVSDDIDANNAWQDFSLPHWPRGRTGQLGMVRKVA